MKKIYSYILGIASVALLQGCYEDKGNYDYHDVNDIKIEIPEAKVRMPKTEAQSVTLTPELSQTMAQNEDNLTFEWLRLKADAKLGSKQIKDYDKYSTGKVCNVEVEPNNPESIGMMLIVSNEETGQKWYELGKITVIKPLNPAWFVLQETPEQRSVVGAVEGDANGFFAYSDVFKSETGESFALNGKPLAIAAKGKYGNKEGIQASVCTRFANLTIATSNEIATYDPSTLTMKYGTNKIMFEHAMNNKPVNLSYYKMDKKGEMFVTDSKAYFAYDDGWCVPYSVYDTQVNDEETKSVVFLPTHFATFGSYVLAYNEDTHRFRLGNAFSGFMDYFTYSRSTMYYRMGSQWKDLKPLQFRDLNDDEEGTYAFDPNSVSSSLQLLDIVCGGDNGNYAYAVMGDGSHSLTVFGFSADWDDPMCKSKATVQLPGDVDLSSARFAASAAYSTHFVFMAAGNSVYRIDLDRQKIETIYTYDADQNAKIACLKFRDPESSEESLGMVLGIAINTSDAKGVMAELQLNVAGDVDRAEGSVFIFNDAANPFGKIVDISYNHE